MKKEKSKENYFHLIPVVSILLVVFILIYVFFLVDGCLPVGNELSKSDWLLFTGSYIAFCGTILVSYLSYRQTKYMFKYNDVEKTKDRMYKINPSFVIEPIGLNGNKSSYKIVNIGDFSAKNVFINEQYYLFIVPNESIFVDLEKTLVEEEYLNEIIVRFENIDSDIFLQTYTKDYLHNKTCYFMTKSELYEKGEVVS